MQVCTSSQITTPTSHHSVFYRLDALLPPNQQCQCTDVKSVLHDGRICVLARLLRNLSGQFVSLIPPHLICPHLTSVPLNWVLCDCELHCFAAHNLGHRGCDQSQCTQLRWNEVRWGEVSDKNSRLETVVLVFTDDERFPSDRLTALVTTFYSHCYMFVSCIETVIGFYFAPGGLQSVVMSSLSVSMHNSKTTLPNFTKFLCMLPVAVAQSFSGSIAKRYVLFILWVTSSFHAMVLWYIVRISKWW